MKLTKTPKFPSDIIDPSQKGKKWHLAYCMAINDDYKNSAFEQRKLGFPKNRKYAVGEQDKMQYLPLVDITQEDLKENETWRNVDIEIFPVAPKFCKQMRTRIRKISKDLKISLIDSKSMSKKRKQKQDIQNYVINKPFYDEMEKISGVSTQSPIPAGVPEPESVQEVELTMDMYIKEPIILEMKDALMQAYKQNDYKQLEEELVDDLVEVGVAGTRSYLGGNNEVPVLRRVLPEHMVIPDSIYANKRDARYIGERLYLTIQELRKMDAGNDLTEGELLDLARKVTNNTKYTSHTVASIQAYYSKHNSYPFDDERVEVLDLEWKSRDQRAYKKKKDSVGNSMLIQEPLSWYEKYNRARKQGKVMEHEAVIETKENIYQAMWVVGTDYIFNWGMQQSMERRREDLSTPKYSFRIYEIKGKSFVEQIKPVLDNIQINWLLMQHHQTQSRPDGLAIDEDSILQLKTPGKGGKQAIDPYENLQMLKITGNLLVRLMNKGGGASSFPVKELKGGMPQAALDHFDAMWKDIELLRYTTGMNEASDGSTINPETGKAVTEAMLASTDDALQYMVDAYLSLYEQTSKRLLFIIPEAIRANEGYSGAPESAGGYFNLSKALAKYEFDCEVIPGLDAEQKHILVQQVSIAQEREKIQPEEALMILNETNIDRAIFMFIQFRKQRLQEEMQKAQQDMQMNNETQTGAVQAKAQADQAITQLKGQLSKDEKIEIKKLEMKMEEMRQQHDRWKTEFERETKLLLNAEEQENRIEIEEYKSVDKEYADERGFENQKELSRQKETSKPKTNQ